MVVPLHVWSGYSLGRGSCTIDRLIERAAALGHAQLALTDVNGLYGATTFWQRAEAAGIRPIVGAELRDASGTSAVALVIDRTGYENLCQIITRLHSDCGFRISDCGLNPQLLAGLHILTASPALAESLLRGSVPVERVWLELDPAMQSRVEVLHLCEAAERLGVGLVASGAALLLDGDALDTARLNASIRLGLTFDSVPPDELPHPQAVLRSGDDIARLCQAIGDEVAREALCNNQRIAEQCAYRLLPQRPVFPKYDCPADQSPREHLRALCREGLTWRYGKPSRQAMQRLNRELDLIERKGFSEYFLVVRDIVQQARRVNAPIAGRGSGASSLTAYVLGITNVCPLKFDLPFERFLHEQREDFPDLDIDFCWRVRDDIINYAFNHWGHDRVAMVSTHNLFQDRSAFRETAKALGLSDEQTSRLQRRGGDEDLLTRVVTLSRRLIDLPHLLSVHPGGIVVGRHEIDRYVPVQPSAKGVRITQLDKDGVEAVGLVKLDLLGNRALSTIREASRRIADCRLPIADCRPEGPTVFCRGRKPPEEFSDRESSPERATEGIQGILRNQGIADSQNPQSVPARRDNPQVFDVERLPSADAATMAMLRRGDTVGVNQLESPAMRSLLVNMQPRDERDIMKVLALIRPGAASIGMKDLFVRRHRGLAEPWEDDPRVEKVLGETHGIMLYEDDVMLVAAAMLHLPLTQADKFRKAVQKCRDDAQRLALSEDFLGRCMANGIGLEYAKGIWVQMAKYNEYSFCRAHAASYARLAYAVAYLKAHHQLAFWTAALNNNQSMYHPRVYVEQAKRAGIRFVGPDVNVSGAEFEIEGDAIRVGLNRIAGLGPVSIESILDARRGGAFGSLSDCLDRTRIGREEAQPMILCGAFDSLGSSRPALMLELNMWKPPRGGRMVGGGGRAGQLALLPARPTVAETLDDYSASRKYWDERRILGISTTLHPMAVLRPELGLAGRGVETIDSRQLRQSVGRRVRIAGLLEAYRATRSINGREVKFFTLDDEWGVFEVTAFEESCRLVGRPAGETAPAIVIGTVEEQFDAISVQARELLFHELHE